MKQRKLKRDVAVALRPRPTSQTTPRGSTTLVVAVCAVLAAAILVIYAQTFTYSFVFFDDDKYLYNNSVVKAGITASNLSWAFTTFYFAIWHPLTWISYMLDCDLFGVNAGAEHAVNVAFHIGSAMLLFLVLWRMTRQLWKSTLAAAIFALHPLRVESVAWISERKDVLSTFLLMLTLLLYTRYVSDPRRKKYLWMALAFALSLLAKAMAVTLPLVLLLMDWWPLRRMGRDSGPAKLRSLVWEKLPLVGMAAMASVLSCMAQPADAAKHAQFAVRLANIPIAYVGYLEKAFWPADLAVLYPFQRPAASATAAALLLLTVITVAAVRLRRRHPYVLAGWLWYLCTLVPVIGLVTFGIPIGMADRFTYVPLIGISITVIWMTDAAIERWPRARQTAAAIAVLAVTAMSAVAWRQAAYWKNSETLFEHTLAITGSNPVIENDLGSVLMDAGKSKEAESLFRRVIAHGTNNKSAAESSLASPDQPVIRGMARNNLGLILISEGRASEAVGLLRQAIADDPASEKAHNSLGMALMRMSDGLDEARTQFETAVRLKPDYFDAHNNLAAALLRTPGRLWDALIELQSALRISPNAAEVHYNLGAVLSNIPGRLPEAIKHFETALAVAPDFDTHYALALAMLRVPERRTEARAHLQAALRLRPDSGEVRQLIQQLGGNAVIVN